MVKLPDGMGMAIVHYPSILLVPFSAICGNLQPIYKQFCWYNTSFFVDFSLIYNDVIFKIPIEQKSLMIYVSDYMVIKHCPSNHLIQL